MRISDTLVKNMIVTADLLNTINGGMSMPSFQIKRKEVHYELDVKAPGISAEALKVEIHNRLLSVFHYLDYASPEQQEGDIGAPNIIHLMAIPSDVELDSIRAEYKANKLKVIMPFNEVADGYHRSVDIYKK